MKSQFHGLSMAGLRLNPPAFQATVCSAAPSGGVGARGWADSEALGGSGEAIYHQRGIENGMDTPKFMNL